MSVHDDVVYAAARLNADGKAPQGLEVRFAATICDHELHLRDGQISGVLDDSKSLGSWKCLVIRPDWPVTDRLTGR